MWEWFTANGIWILVASGVGVVLLLFIRQRVQGRIEKIAVKERRKTLERSMRLTVWVIGGILLAIIALAATAIITSREGVSSVITTETIQKWFLEHGILILVIVLISYLVYRVLKVVMPEIIERSVRIRGKGRRAREELAKRSGTLSAILTQVAGIIIIIVALFMILSEVGIDITPLLAGAGVAGIAIGLGAQSLIKDVLNGLFILLEDQYNKGDVVQVAGITGLVEEVNLRRTILRDLDGIVHTIPNGEVKTASNFTRDWSRAHLNVSVAYKEDLDRVMAIIRKTWEETAEDPNWGPLLISKTPWLLRVNEFGDSGIVIKAVGETKPIRQWDVMGELRRRIKKAFDEQGVEIPWPHLKLYFGKSEQSQIEGGLTCKACSHLNPPGSRFCSNCGVSLGS